MAIQNIQGLVDKNGLSYITSGNFLDKYYDSALANLGQRNTNDSLLENITFTIKDVFDELKQFVNNNVDPYMYVIYYNEDINSIGKFYTLVKNKIESQFNINEFSPIDITDIKDIIELLHVDDIASLVTNGYITELSIESMNTNDNSYLILNKKLNIIDQLFTTITQSRGSNIRKNRILIPLNYQFGYIANGINKSIIYHSFKDIYVNVIPEDFGNDNDDYELESIDYYQGNIFYCNDQKFIKTDIYDYLFVEDQIICSLKFTLPYINENDYWIINNQETSIQAKAHDAVNLNIILAYYYKVGNAVEYKYLSGLNNNFNINRITPNVDSYKFIIQNDADVIKCEIHTPSIIKENITKADVKLNTVLQNSTLIIISKITDIIESNQNIDITKYGDGFVTTLWNYGDNGFECICLDNGVALDFNQLTNFDNLLKYEIQNVEQIKPDNFLHRHLIFDQIYQQLKQDSSQPIYAYPVLQNIKGSQYNNKYTNNMNFSLKYVNYISGEINKDIKGISKSSDTKYLHNTNNIVNASNSVTNSLYQYVTDNKVNYYNEYIPNYNIPVFDVSEILIKDINTLNKYNILTFNFDGTMYYSYIGTTHNTDKNVLTIGSSNININLGENTLTDYNTKKTFNKQNIINIDFNTINANGNLHVKKDLEVKGNINLKSFEWIHSKVNGHNIQSTSFIPQFRYYSFNNHIYKEINIASIEQEIKNFSNEISSKLPFGSDAAKQYLYICPIIKVTSVQNQLTYRYKYNDLLVLPNLVKYLGLDSSSVTNFESNTNDIISVNGEQLYLVSSNSILSDSISVINSTDTGITIEVTNTSDYYLGNMLYVTYVPDFKRLIVNEVQTTKVKSIWKIPTNIN